MEGWTIERVALYCKSKNWLLEFPVQADREQNHKEIGLKNMQKDYSNIFGPIGKAKPMGGGFTPRIGVGSHKLALKSYKVKDSNSGKGQYLEAEYVVVASSTHATGEARSWVWFINSLGWSAAYEQDRAKKFLEAVGACVGDTSPVEVIGGNLAGDDQAGKGLILECAVTPQGGKNAGKTNARGEVYTNIYWTPVKQSLEELAVSRAEIEAMELASAPAPAEPARPAGLFGRK